ncbi:hypothetical protein SHKM778_51250 [Streptomyces sp. KM77-8]|uniref:Uncharacterized protein n=1 Tax=Streptomyces haneummycinicus TaxID=3074435 RepID=A0AAT9HMP7_9ACTN
MRAAEELGVPGAIEAEVVRDDVLFVGVEEEVSGLGFRGAVLAPAAPSFPSLGASPPDPFAQFPAPLEGHGELREQPPLARRSGG